MNKKRKIAIAFVIALFLFVALEITYIFSELYSESEIPGESAVTDAIKFKEEYEKYNGQVKGDTIIRTINIPKDNPFIYSTAEEIAKKMNRGESFVVYFGFGTCPWCRSVLPSLIDAAKESKITKIYYVDVLNIRDKFELNEKNKAVRTVEGSEGYYALIEKMGNVLSDYSPLTYTVKKKTKIVKINEKRIYAPNVVAVKDGKAIALETGIVNEFNDPYGEISDSLACKFKEKFNCLFEEFDENFVCDLNSKKC